MYRYRGIKVHLDCHRPLNVLVSKGAVQRFGVVHQKLRKQRSVAAYLILLWAFTKSKQVKCSIVSNQSSESILYLEEFERYIFTFIIYDLIYHVLAHIGVVNRHANYAYLRQCSVSAGSFSRRAHSQHSWLTIPI